MAEIKIKCVNPCCASVAYIRINNRGDDFLTCPKCGPYNGKGPAFRQWCADLRAQYEKPEPVEAVPGDRVVPGQTSDEVGDAHTQGDWLNEL